MRTAHLEQENQNSSFSVLKEENFFDRIEDKYLINTTALPLLMEKIGKIMLPSYNGEDVSYTLIESIYFDSSSLDFYQHHLQDLPIRYKMRIRKYAPGGMWNNNMLFWEIKKKEMEKSKKTRFIIDEQGLNELEIGSAPKFSQELLNINNHLGEDRLRKRIDKVQELYKKFALIPALKIRYLRHAFEFDQIRVTIDRNINAFFLLSLQISNLKTKSYTSIRNAIFNSEVAHNKILEIINKHYGNNMAIIEVKHREKLPLWMNDLLQEFNLEKTSFSKYCYFMTKHISSESHKTSALLFDRDISSSHKHADS